MHTAAIFQNSPISLFVLHRERHTAIMLKKFIKENVKKGLHSNYIFLKTSDIRWDTAFKRHTGRPFSKNYARDYIFQDEERHKATHDNQNAHRQFFRSIIFILFFIECEQMHSYQKTPSEISYFTSLQQDKYTLAHEN